MQLIFELASQVLHGFGGGGLMTPIQVLVDEDFRSEDRSRLQKYLAIGAKSSGTFRPAADGYLAQYADWQPVFLVNIPIAIVAVHFQLKPAPRPEPDWGLNLDFFSLVILAAFVTSTLLLQRKIHAMPFADAVVVLGYLDLVFYSTPKRTSNLRPSAGKQTRENKRGCDVGRSLFDGRCFRPSQPRPLQ